jgi:hypothetical protein
MSININTSPHKTNFIDILNSIDKYFTDGIRVIFFDKKVLTLNTF